jgi:large subunit ribosomal protein L17
LGDNADMAMIELVDFNELYNGGKKSSAVVEKLRKMKLLKLQLLKLKLLLDC